MKKLVRDLLPGDILPRGAYRLRRVVVGFVDNRQPNFVVPKTVDLESPPPVPPGPCALAPPVPPEGYRADDEIEVEQANLTPAQQHADELFNYVTKAALLDLGTHADYRQRAAQELVDKINPPDPVTLDEALRTVAALAKWINIDVERLDTGDNQTVDRVEKEAGALLERARRLGQLP